MSHVELRGSHTPIIHIIMFTEHACMRACMHVNWGNPRISAPTTQLRLLIGQHQNQRKACKESNHPIDPSHLRKPRAKCPNPKAKELTKLVSPITRGRRGGARLDVSFPGLSQRECVSQIRVLCQCPGSRIKPGQLHPQPLYAPIQRAPDLSINCHEVTRISCA